MASRYQLARRACEGWRPRSPQHPSAVQPDSRKGTNTLHLVVVGDSESARCSIAKQILPSCTLCFDLTDGTSRILRSSVRCVVNFDAVRIMNLLAILLAARILSPILVLTSVPVPLAAERSESVISDYRRKQLCKLIDWVTISPSPQSYLCVYIQVC
jgi:hypothetical protein